MESSLRVMFRSASRPIAECRSRLTRELRALAEEIATFQEV
jgi:hypothetical protein